MIRREVDRSTDEAVGDTATACDRPDVHALELGTAVVVAPDGDRPDTRRPPRSQEHGRPSAAVVAIGLLELVEPFERLLRDGVIDRSLRVDDPHAEATLIANTVCWTYLHMRRAHRWSTAQTADQLITLTNAHLIP